MRYGRVMGLLVAGFVVAAPLATSVSAAPCVKACKDEVAACVAADCQTLSTKRQRRHCHKSCNKTIVQDCYRDLSICGATTARPTPPPAGGSSGGGGGSGGW